MFTTQRLRLRTWQPTDLTNLHALLSDPLTMAHWPQPLDEAQARAWLERSSTGMRDHGYARWCCERLADGRIIGDVGIMRTELEGEWVNDLGYIIHHDFWRNGYAVEAAQGAVGWAKANGLEVLVANMAIDNTPSVGVAEKLGMLKKREFIKANNMAKPTFWYELQLNCDDPPAT